MKQPAVGYAIAQLVNSFTRGPLHLYPEIPCADRSWQRKVAATVEFHEGG